MARDAIRGYLEAWVKDGQLILEEHVHPRHSPSAWRREGLASALGASRNGNST